MGKKKHILTGIAILALVVPAAARAASGETANSHILLSQIAINQQTCRFAFPERDPATGPTWQDLRGYVLYEDARHDAKLACLARHMGEYKAGAPGKRGPRGAQGPAGPAGPAGGVSGYVRVTAPIDFKQASASATCPAGDVVLGGGATVEVEGSYPSTDTTWTVTRDNTWGHLKTGTVYAVCARSAS